MTFYTMSLGVDIFVASFFSLKNERKFICLKRVFANDVLNAPNKAPNRDFEWYPAMLIIIIILSFVMQELHPAPYTKRLGSNE